MKTIFVSALVILLLLQTSAGLADKGGDKHPQAVEITFTKWITDSPQMEGFVGGDVVGDFSGQVLQSQLSANGRLNRLEAMYEIHGGDRSFTALVRGGKYTETGKGLLEGVIHGGWRTGARVQVEFDQQTDCPGAPAGTCFQGTIRVERAPKD
jgi:hypothetical protein